MKILSFSNKIYINYKKQKLFVLDSCFFFPNFEWIVNTDRFIVNVLAIFTFHFNVYLFIDIQ